MRKLSEILEIGMTKYNPYSANAEPHYMCIVLRHLVDLPEEEVEFAEREIENKISPSFTLLVYLLDHTDQFESLSDEEYNEKMPKAQIQFYKDWIEELKKEGK